ncbi:MAG: hypothetical protein V4719_06985 [Planctomycetota bacterium]
MEEAKKIIVEGGGVHRDFIRAKYRDDRCSILDEIVTIRLLGWGDELKTIAAIKLIRELAGMDLFQSKTLVEDVMQGHVGTIQVHGLTSAERFVYDAAQCGLIAEIE